MLHPSIPAACYKVVVTRCDFVASASVYEPLSSGVYPYLLMAQLCHGHFGGGGIHELGDEVC